MRTIKEDEELETLVKVGDIVRLEGFTDEPVIAVVVSGGNDCSGCAIDIDVSCAVTMRDPEGNPVSISPCCFSPSWMPNKGTPRFGKFKPLDKVLEDL